MTSTPAAPQIEVCPRRRRLGAVAPYLAITAVGLFLFWYCGSRPAQTPWVFPFDFSPAEYLGIALSAYWFLRGTALTDASERPALWRKILFFVGLALLWVVMQTHYDYLAQHMFFLMRIQHVVMHHLGPFLIALSAPGSVIKKGMPAFAVRWAGSKPVALLLAVLQQPFVAAFLFVGLVAFWLIPSIHFVSMIDARLYALMNWSMVIDGLLFWSLVLDPRPQPLARLSYGARAALSFGVMFPQIAIGAAVAFATYDLYPYYNLCGRVFPSIGAMQDQEIAGIILWIPPAMMSVIGVIATLNFMRLHEESQQETREESAALAALSSAWTGR